MRSLPPDTRAREQQAHVLTEQVLEIADEAARLGLDVQAARLRIDARKWLASKVLPRISGDRAHLEHTGADGGPVRAEQVVVVFGDKEIPL
jgi:hypothetical protein